MSIIRTVKNIFGGSTYYDETGEVIGRSVENVFGGETIHVYDREEVKPPPLKKSAEWLDEIDFSKYDLDD